MFGGIAQKSLSPYPEVYGGTNEQFQEIKLEDYLKLNPHSEAFVRCLAQATLPIYNRGNYLHGNGVAISKDLVLVPRHCVDGGNVNLGYAGIGKIIFDGTFGREKLDFAIVWIEGANFSPITLDVVPGFGESIQMYFKSIPTYPYLQRYVKPFESGQGEYAERSDQTTSSTELGESGAPRMSLRNGWVHAIHQGESEGLKMNDVYFSLQQASENSAHPQQENAKKILGNIQVANLEMLFMTWSSIGLKQEDVQEEKRRVIGKVPVTVEIKEKNKSKEITGIFSYREVGEGKDHRQVVIHREGVANSQITYTISPDPDENQKYREGGQKKFYETLATAVGSYYLLNKKYLSEGTVEVFKEKYKLTAYIEI